MKKLLLLLSLLLVTNAWGEAIGLNCKVKGFQSQTYYKWDCSDKYEDLSRKEKKLFDKGKVGQSYNVGTGFIINNLQLVQKIIKIYRFKFARKKIRIEFVKDRPGHDFRYALNSSKIKKKLGWKHLYSFDKALVDTIEWYLRNPKFYSNKQRRKFNKRLGLIND